MVTAGFAILGALTATVWPDPDRAGARWFDPLADIAGHLSGMLTRTGTHPGTQPDTPAGDPASTPTAAQYGTHSRNPIAALDPPEVISNIDPGRSPLPPSDLQLLLPLQPGQPVHLAPPPPLFVPKPVEASADRWTVPLPPQPETPDPPPQGGPALPPKAEAP